MNRTVKTAVDTFIAWTWWVNIWLRSRWGYYARRDKHPSDARRLLLLAWWLPPSVSPGVYRPLSQIQYAAQLGWNVSVVSGPKPNAVIAAGEHLARSIPASVDILRTDPTNLQTSWRLVPQLHDDSFVNSLNMTRSVMSQESRGLPSVIVASGPPFSTFVSAYHLGKFFGVPYVLDYRDLWSECQLGYFNTGRNSREWERACLRKAAAIIFTTKSQMQHQIEKFPELRRDKCYVVENGWEPADFSPIDFERTLNTSGDNFIYLAFLGTIVGHSSPLPFLSCLYRVLTRRHDLRSHVRVRLVGAVSETLKAALANNSCRDVIEYTEFTTRPRAYELMQTSHALLVFSPPGLAMYRPGKIYAYVAARRPVLIYGSRGETSDLVEELRCGRLISDNDDISLEKAIDDIIARKLAPRSDAAVSTWLAARTRATLAHYFLQIVESVAHKSPHH